MTSSWFFLSTLNYDARSTTHQIACKVDRCTMMFKQIMSHTHIGHYKYVTQIYILHYIIYHSVIQVKNW